VGAAFVALLSYVDYIKSDQGVKACDLSPTQRSERGDRAVQLAVEMQRAMLALIGTHRRRTYAHDLVYGTHQLYMLFGKPWNAATEGNEHAHQDMKRFFHELACHNPRNPHSDCYAVLRLTVVKTHLLQTKTLLLAQNKYAASRANHVMQADAATAQGKKRGRESGPKGLKLFEAEEGKITKRGACAQRVHAALVLGQEGCGCGCAAPAPCMDCEPEAG
jgi:hypothetical protein